MTSCNNSPSPSQIFTQRCPIDSNVHACGHESPEVSGNSFFQLSLHSSTSTAYNSALLLLQDSLVFSPTLETQHFHLVTMRDNYERLPLDYAPYQVHIGQLKEAIETLETGRGLLWSEMRGFRTPIDQLCMVNSDLAGKFAAVNRDLK
jgi:hypothetical protein